MQCDLDKRVKLPWYNNSSCKVPYKLQVMLPSLRLSFSMHVVLFTDSQTMFNSIVHRKNQSNEVGAYHRMKWCSALMSRKYVDSWSRASSDGEIILIPFFLFF